MFPVALPDGGQHVTKLNMDATHFAYEHSLNYYVALSAPPQITNHLLDISHVRNTFTSSMSCIYALFMNHASAIRTYCSFTLVPNGFESSVVLLDTNTVLF